jgi:hypothetical protein
MSTTHVHCGSTFNKTTADEITRMIQDICDAEKNKASLPENPLNMTSQANYDEVYQLRWIRDQLEAFQVGVEISDLQEPAAKIRAVSVNFRHISLRQRAAAEHVLSQILNPKYAKFVQSELVHEIFTQSLGSARMRMEIEGLTRVFYMPAYLRIMAYNMPECEFKAMLLEDSIKLSGYLHANYETYQGPSLSRLDNVRRCGTQVLLRKVTCSPRKFNQFKNVINLLKNILAQIPDYPKEWFDDTLYFLDKFVCAYNIEGCPGVIDYFAYQCTTSVVPDSRFLDVHRLRNRVIGRLIMLLKNNGHPQSEREMLHLVYKTKRLILKRKMLNQKYHN